MKLNKKWIAVLLLVVMALCLTACGEKKEEAPKAAETSKSAVFGKWKQVSENEYMGDSEFYYEFSEGNKLKATEVRSGEIVRSYEMTDGYVMNSETTGVVKDEYDEHPFKIDGDVMTIDVEGNGTTFLTLKKEK